MENLCRLCSSQSPTSTSVFSIKNGRLLLDMITIICPVKIDISDTLPKTICSLCLRIVLDAVDLRERSILSDLSLRTRCLGGKFVDVSKTIENYRNNYDGSEKRHLDELKSRKSQDPSNFSIPTDPIKIEEEKVESNVINFVEESQTSHEDYSSYDNDQNFNDDQSEFTNYEPPSKLLKTDDSRCENCNCHKASVINHELNEKIKQYFRKPLQKGGKWKCHICQKEYAGHLNNMKEHLSIIHKDIAQMLGLTMKIRARNKDKMSSDAKSDNSGDGSFSDFVLHNNSN
ncbi:unnamed protein product [Chironomus riparius]|uniref:ZAD domain-containing protein n=1 Tax=Chironomus riparius TaxID=315576 RepID=A0A9N9SBS0_9DIPT|nr:unnamed protein product [Chironomus riparius]